MSLSSNSGTITVSQTAGTTHLAPTNVTYTATIETSGEPYLANIKCQRVTDATSTKGGTLPTAFSYAGKAARLLTAQELMKGCGLTQVGSYTVGELRSTNCKFLFEGTKYANSSKATYGPWLETPNKNYAEFVYYLSAYGRLSDNAAASDGSSAGVRPTIDVRISDIAK